MDDEEEYFADGLSFVPYVIHVGDALDVEDTVEVKPILPVPMIFDEVDRGGPDEVVDEIDRAKSWDERNCIDFTPPTNPPG